jgi:HEAT repeat protein
MLSLVFVLLSCSSTLHAQSNTTADLHQMSTDQVLQVFHSDDPAQRRLAINELNGRRDAFVPLLKVIATEQDPKIRDAALFPCCCGAPSVGQPVPPEAQDAVNAAIPVLVQMAEQTQIPDMTLQLLQRIATPQQLLPTLRKWLAPGRNQRAMNSGGHDQYMIAMEILTSMPIDAPPEAVQLVADQVDGPYMSEQTLKFLAQRMPSTEPLLLKMMQNDPQVGGSAITALSGGRNRVLKFSPAARAVLEQMLNFPQQGTVEIAMQALLDVRRGASPDAMPRMVARLNEPKLRPTIAKVITNNDPRRTESILLSMLHAPDLELRRTVVDLLCRQDYDRYRLTPPVQVFDAINDPDDKIRNRVSTFVSYCGHLNAVVGPVTNLKAFRLRTRHPANEPAAVPPYATPAATAAAAGASSWNLPPLLPPILFALSLLIWPLLVLIALGTLAERLMTKAQASV